MKFALTIAAALACGLICNNEAAADIIITPGMACNYAVGDCERKHTSIDTYIQYVKCICKARKKCHNQENYRRLKKICSTPPKLEHYCEALCGSNRTSKKCMDCWSKADKANKAADNNTQKCNTPKIFDILRPCFGFNTSKCNELQAANNNPNTQRCNTPTILEILIPCLELNKRKCNKLQAGNSVNEGSAP
ncbi:MAG: hypothetical protein FWC40_06950 [Proteobacteria bacterium]|nr:hypothetical protein [Pseudomonadota bacterium]